MKVERKRNREIEGGRKRSVQEGDKKKVSKLKGERERERGI